MNEERKIYDIGLEQPLVVEYIDGRKTVIVPKGIDGNQYIKIMEDIKNGVIKPRN